MVSDILPAADVPEFVITEMILSAHEQHSIHHTMQKFPLLMFATCSCVQFVGMEKE